MCVCVCVYTCVCPEVIHELTLQILIFWNSVYVCKLTEQLRSANYGLCFCVCVCVAGRVCKYVQNELIMQILVLCGSVHVCKLTSSCVRIWRGYN